VLLRPQALVDAVDLGHSESPYVALIKDAQDTTEARIKAQNEAFATDCRDVGRRKMENLDMAPHRYELCVMFKGIHTPALYGWQVPTPARSEA
jgi:hypothetical protein